MMTTDLPVTRTGCRADPTLPPPCNTCDIRDLSICSSLTPAEQAQMLSDAAIVKTGPRQILFHDTDRAEHVFNVVRGRVALFKALSDGRRHVIRFAGPGNFIGLSSELRYSTSAESLTEVSLCKFPRSKLVQMADTVPALERLLLTRAEKSVAVCFDHMFLLGRKTSMERVCSFLLEEAVQFGRKTGQTDLELPMLRSEIGDHLGLTQETVSRCLAQLVKRGVISIPGPHRVTLVDINAAERLARGNCP